MKAVTHTTHLNRFAEIAKLGDIVFHTNDLANVWRITNKNTLYTTIKRYVEQGLLYRIYKGFYSIKKPAEVDPLLLGVKALHSYGYVSTETILAENGIIQQEVSVITLISRQTKRFSAAGHDYYSRKLDDQFLHQSLDISESVNGVRKATPERAVADLLYFNKQSYLDGSNRVDWRKVRAIQEELGYPLTPKRY